MSKQEQKTKGMCIATRCTTVEQFVQMFHRFVDEDSFFVSTLNTRPAGLETSFSVQLVDGTPVLRGLCVVLQAWPDTNNPFKTPGVRLGIKRLTANSMTVFEQLLVTRSAGKPPPKLKIPTSSAAPQAIPPVATKPIAGAVPPTPPSSPLSVAAKPKLGAIPPIAPLKPPASTPSTPSTLPGPALAKSPAEPAPAKSPAEPALAKRPAEPAPAAPAPAPVPPGLPPKPPITDAAPKSAAAEPVSLPRASTGDAIPEAVGPEPTDVIEEKTDVRETRPDVKPPRAPTPPPDETRTPGSDIVLPANPLMNLTDESLEGYVDCTLYEETGNFFPVDDETGFLIDDLVPPPAFAPRPVIARAPTPPPIAGEARARTITPLPIPPDRAAGLDSPDLAASGDEVTTKRDSAPAITTPPPLGAADAATNPVVDAFAAHAAPGERLTATPQKRPPWLLLGGVGVLAVATVGVIITTSSSDGGNPTTKQTAAITTPAKQPATTTATPANPPPADVEHEPPPPGEDSQPDPGVARDGQEEPALGEGAPIVGSGPCKVVVLSTPAGSIVQLDGASVGPSPLTVATSCTKHTIEISHPRYAPSSKIVTLTEGTPAQVELTLSRPTHVVTVTSQPTGATIFINGNRAGTTPTKLSVLGFVTLKLELKKTGYQTATTKLYSKVSQDNVSVRLTKW